jgi:hypothetical protein
MCTESCCLTYTEEFPIYKLRRLSWTYIRCSKYVIKQMDRQTDNTVQIVLLLRKIRHITNRKFWEECVTSVFLQTLQLYGEAGKKYKSMIIEFCDPFLFKIPLVQITVH